MNQDGNLNNDTGNDTDNHQRDNHPVDNHPGDSHRDTGYKPARQFHESRQFYESRHFPEWYLRTRNMIYYVLGVIEVLLAFRLIFKVLGASTRNGLVQFIYSVTNVLNAPFTGIFRIFYPGGAAGRFVFEPATVIAMIVYALIARGIISLVKLSLPESA